MINIPSATQLGPSKHLCHLLRSVSSHVCLHNFQPSYRNHLRSSYSSQASLLTVFAHTAGAGNEFAGGKCYLLFARSARLGGQYPSTNPCAMNDRASFLPVKLSTVDLMNIWGSWLSLERSMMKSSMFFEHRPLPPYVHLASTRHHSRDRCSQAFPVFRHSTASVYYTERKPRNKKQGRPWNEATPSIQRNATCQVDNTFTMTAMAFQKKAGITGHVYYRKSAVPILIPSQNCVYQCKLVPQVTKAWAVTCKGG